MVTNEPRTDALRRPLAVFPITHASEVADEFDLLVGVGDGMQQVFHAIERAARHDGPVLIEGEPGTGKELVARAIHQRGKRSAASLEVVDCAAYSAEELERQLFGTHECDFPILERCREGTLLLQEVGALSLTSQARLVRWLGQFGCGRRPGELAAARLLCSSTRELSEQVQQQSFRNDLYYQLAGVRIRVPRLSDRPEDLPLLVRRIMARLRDSGHVPVDASLHVSQDVMDRFLTYTWPGNLNELCSALRQCLAEGEGQVTAHSTFSQSLGKYVAQVPQNASTNAHTTSASPSWVQWINERLTTGSEDLYTEAVSELETTLLPMVMNHTKGNQSRAARILGITRASLRKKLRMLATQYTSRIYR